MGNGLSVGPIDVKTTEDHVSTAHADVDGAPVTYSSTGATLSENADALLCAFLLPALAANRPLIMHDPIDEKLFENVPRIAAIARDWWRFGSPALSAGTTRRRAKDGTGQFFTAGVDSFFTLWRNRNRVDCLINVFGFDIELADKDRFAASASAIGQVARELSIEPIFVRTTLREHPTFQSLSWTVTHIAALSSIAHLLTSRLGTIYIASSDVPAPHGSHPSLDYLWSSNAVELINDEDGISRLTKVETIGQWPLAQKYLKVCWENRAKSLNCGECEKCVRTQAQLATFGVLEQFETFPSGSLTERIQALPTVAPHLARQWHEIRDRIGEPSARAAIDGLLARCAHRDRVQSIERRVWDTLAHAKVTSGKLRSLDEQYCRGVGRRSYYAVRRRLGLR